MASSFLIAGLGNPGKKYQFTRHNIGFLVVDQIAKDFSCSFKRGLKYRIARFDYHQKKIFLIKPTTYMNLSGLAVIRGIKKCDLDISNLMVISDDLNLPLGKLRLRTTGSAGGHKGLQSIIETLATEAFCRLRIGIAASQKISDVVNYVLTQFDHAEIPDVSSSVKLSAECVLYWIDNGINKAMNKFNS